MTTYRIVMLDTINGEVFSEDMECYGFPSLVDPYMGIAGRMGIILRVEKVLVATPANQY